MQRKASVLRALTALALLLILAWPGAALAERASIRVENASIAGVPVKAGRSGANWVLENDWIRVTVKPDGSATYKQVGAWPDEWAAGVTVSYDYTLGGASGSASYTFAKPIPTGGGEQAPLIAMSSIYLPPA